MPEKPLYIVWNFNSQAAAEYLVFIYAITNLTRKEREEITIIITGPACKVVSESENIQQRIKDFAAVGGVVKVCQASAEEFGVLDALQSVKGTEFIEKFDMEELAKEKDVSIMKY